MQPDRNPTFAEALLALVIADKEWHEGAAIGDAWKSASDRASAFVRGPILGGSLVDFAPPSIRRALVVDGHGTAADTYAENAPCLHSWLGRDGYTICEKCMVDQRDAHIDPDFYVKPILVSRYARAKRDLAAAVARAEKAEEQMRHDSDARQMAEAGRASAVEAMCASERKCDALRAELDKAKADVMAANLRARTAQDERDDIKAKLADAVARAEKAEAALERITRTRVDTVCPYCNEHLCSHGISETEREIVTSHAKICPKHPNREVERELDALRAELEEAMVSRSGLEAYSRQMEKDRDKWNAQCAAAEIECAKLRSERDSLRAELDKAKADVMAANLRARTAQDERDSLKAELDKKRGEVAAIEVNGRFYGKDDIRELIEAFESAAAGCGSLAAKLALAEKQRDFSAYLHTDISAKLAAARKALDAKEQP